MVHLNGVDFNTGHHHWLFLETNPSPLPRYYKFGPYPIKSLTHHLRLGQPFTVVQAPAAIQVAEIVKKEAALQTRDLRVLIDVCDSKSKLYQILLRALIQEYRVTAHNELVICLNPRAIYETHSQQLQAFLG